MNSPNHHSFVSIPTINSKLKDSKLLDSKDSKYIKTGVIGDGSCFIHAVLHAVSSTYREYDISKRIAHVYNIRQQLSISLEQIKKLGQGELYRILFLEHLHDIVKEYSDISLTVWEKHFIPYISNHWKTTSHSDITSLLHHQFTILTDLQRIWKYTDQLVEKTFQQRLRNEWIDEYMIEYFCKLFQRNIIMLHDRDKQLSLYKLYPETFKYPKYVVLIWLDECHYEVLGKVIHQGTSIQRQFTKEDDIIRLYTIRNNECDSNNNHSIMNDDQV